MNKEIYSKIMIVGCGTLGSELTKSLVLKDIDVNLIEELIIVDNDILEVKNIPYLNILSKKSSSIGKPKVYVLNDYINHLTQTISVKSYVLTYGEFKNRFANLIRDFLIIDCRDTNEVLKNTYLKLNLDGSFGIARYNPKEKISDRYSRYSYGNSKFNAKLFTPLVVQHFFSMTFSEEKNYAFNLENVANGGVIHVFK